MLSYHLIKLCPHDLLNFDVLKLHVTNCNGHHFTINRIIHMTSHHCPTNNTFHMIKHDPNIPWIPYRLHLHDKARSTPHTIYRHLENENLLSYNLFWEATLLDIIIAIIRLQFKDAINIAMPWMMLERNNQVTNVEEFISKNVSWICFNCFSFKSSTRPSPLSSNICVAKKVMLTLSEIAYIFALGVWSTSFMINLLVLSTYSLHLLFTIGCLTPRWIIALEIDWNLCTT